MAMKVPAPKKGGPEARPPQNTETILRLAAAILSAGGGVTRERETGCGQTIDSWKNTTDEDAKAEITIESVSEVTCGKIEVRAGGEAKLTFGEIFSEKLASGPHKLKAPKGKDIELVCGSEQRGKCKVKYTFRWQ